MELHIIKMTQYCTALFVRINSKYTRWDRDYYSNGHPTHLNCTCGDLINSNGESFSQRRPIINLMVTLFWHIASLKRVNRKRRQQKQKKKAQLDTWVLCHTAACLCCTACLSACLHSTNGVCQEKQWRTKLFFLVSLEAQNGRYLPLLLKAQLL
jgi:hypothetical protein